MSPARLVLPAALLAGAALVPSLQAFDIAGDTWKLSIKPRIQTRIEFASASDAAGDDYDIWDGSDNPQDVNFSLRRLRLTFAGSNDDGWGFTIGFHADGLGRTNQGGGDPAMRYASVKKTIKQDDLTHLIYFGYDDFTAVTAFSDNSAQRLFPNIRATAGFAINPTTVGLGYRLTAPAFGFQLGIQDETGNDNNDWRISARVWTGLTSDMSLTSRPGSFLGKPSNGIKHQLGLGVDLRTDGSTSTEGTEDNDYAVLVLDYLLHFDAWTLLVDVASISRGDASQAGGVTAADPDATTAGSSGLIALIQAGYAIPLADGAVVEPALRLTYLDLDDDNDDEQAVLRNEGGGSGMSIDLGVNYYPTASHNNKFQAGLQIFTPEDGDGDAFVFRVQHQLNF